MSPRLRLATFALVALAATGCASRSHRDAGAAAMAIDLARTRPLGSGPEFRPPPVGNPAVALGAPVGRLRCGPGPHSSYGAHIELFALNRGIAVPAGIGVAPPQHRAGAVVTGGRCAYPLRTVDPTGVVEVDSTIARAPSVGELFELWGQPLSYDRLGRIAAPPGASVAAFVDGHRWSGDPRAIPLRRHVQIVLELGPPVEPHPSYTFPPTL
jgi:hypothetical protein